MSNGSYIEWKDGTTCPIEDLDEFLVFMPEEYIIVEMGGHEDIEPFFKKKVNVK